VLHSCLVHSAYDLSTTVFGRCCRAWPITAGQLIVVSNYFHPSFRYFLISLRAFPILDLPSPHKGSWFPTLESPPISSRKSFQHRLERSVEIATNELCCCLTSRAFSPAPSQTLPKIQPVALPATIPTLSAGLGSRLPPLLHPHSPTQPNPTHINPFPI